MGALVPTEIFYKKLCYLLHSMVFLVVGNSWDQQQQQVFPRLKDDLITSPVLAHCDPQRQTAVSSDASSFGIGAGKREKLETSHVLFQRLDAHGLTKKA